MSCPHAATTTVAFLYGEAPDAHALHVASCAECEGVVTEHEQVATALAPTLGAIRSTGVAPSPRRFGAVGVVAGGVLLAMAATVLLMLRIEPPPVEAPAAGVPDGFDVAIDELDLELTSLELELL